MKIMVVNRQAQSRDGIIDLLKGKPDIEIIGEPNSEKEIVDQALSYQPDIILMGAGFFVEDGKAIMQGILSQAPDTAFVILAPGENRELLLNAIRSGAKGYLQRSISETALLKSLYAVERGEIVISRAMTSEIISEFHRISAKAVSSEHERLSALTYREMEVLRLLASEVSNQEIGRQLFISNNTVRVHVHNILEKLQAKNRREAAKFAQRLSISTNGFQSHPREKERIMREK